MALAQGVNRITRGTGKRLRIPGENAITFYVGGYAQVDKSVGLVKKAADTSNFTGFGIVQRQVTADAAAGRNEVELLVSDGNLQLVAVNITGVDNQNDVGDPVYATADDTLTMSATANTKPIGTLSRYYGSGTKGDVDLYPYQTDQAF